MERGGCTYIMTNTFNNVYYIGVTSDLYSRVLEHKEKRYPTSFVFYPTIEEAIGDEKRLKKWNRDWKIKLIGDQNPKWIDLFDENL